VSDDEVTLIDESGGERRFRLHDAVDLNGYTYYLVEAVDDPDQVLILRETEGTLDAVHGDELDKVLAVLDSEE
jgi:hypothetical protein